MSFQTIDYVILVAYIVIIVGVGLWVTRRKKGEGERDAEIKGSYTVASRKKS